MIMCYLAGPIDYNKEDGRTWKTHLYDLCAANYDIGFFDPYSPYKFNKIDSDLANYIHDVNMVAMSKADVVVGSLHKHQVSVGTPIEFYQMLGKKPILIHTDMNESVYMRYIQSYRYVEFFNSIDLLSERLKKIAHDLEKDKAKMRVGP